MTSEDRFLSLYLEHQSNLAGFARALLPDWEATDEVLQESSVVMWRKISQLQAPEEFLPWAKVILQFEVLKHRRKYRRDRLVLDETTIRLLVDESLEEKDSLDKDRLTALRTCLGEFSAEHCELLLAPYRGDGAVTRLAGAAGKTANSLYKVLGRLRVKLHDCVAWKHRSIGDVSILYAGNMLYCRGADHRMLLASASAKGLGCL